MFRILKATADTYITDKIVDGVRVTDANTGKAATLDLFKLYDESIAAGSSEPQVELSRALIKFDISPLRALTGTILDYTHPSFKCTLRLRDVYGGQTVPTNYTLVLHPLSRSFDEGLGRDIALFQDIDAANYLTASVSSGLTLWSSSGASRMGLLGSDDIDVISSASWGGDVVDLEVRQVFDSAEDLEMDVTTVVSATLAGLIPDCGFRLSYASEQEEDTQSRFVKRFASRQASDPRLRPRIEVRFDDSVLDDHKNFVFDVSGTLFLRNAPQGCLSHLLSGSTPLTGEDCLLVTLSSGSFTTTISASQHSVGNNYFPGLYSASFFLSSQESHLRDQIQRTHSATFTEIWSSVDRTIGYHTGTLDVQWRGLIPLDAEGVSLVITSPGLRTTYKTSEKARIRICAFDNQEEIRFSRVPLERVGKILRWSYYQVRDAHSNEVVIPFDTVSNSTRLSADTQGMYFDLYMDSLEKGRVYSLDVLVSDNGVDQIYSGVGGRFKVVE